VACARCSRSRSPRPCSPPSANATRTTPDHKTRAGASSALELPGTHPAGGATCAAKRVPSAPLLVRAAVRPKDLRVDEGQVGKWARITTMASRDTVMARQAGHTMHSNQTIQHNQHPPSCPGMIARPSHTTREDAAPRRNTFHHQHQQHQQQAGSNMRDRENHVDDRNRRQCERVHDCMHHYR
jgi:hypothetical protein